jgi:hypothetical protein
MTTWKTVLLGLLLSSALGAIQPAGQELVTITLVRWPFT